MTHDLKSTPDKFQEVKAGLRRFEFRLNDRNYAAGDLLCLREFVVQTQRYTGDTLTAKVLHITQGDGISMSNQFVVMSIGEPILNKR